MTFELTNKFMVEELKIEDQNYIYQHTSLLVALLPYLESSENFEACAIIMQILKDRGINNSLK